MKHLKGYHHLLALSVTDPDLLASLVKRGENGWGLSNMQGAIAAWAAATMGTKATPVLDALAERWPDNVAAERAWLATQP